MAFRTGEVADDEIVAEINITPLTDIFLVLLIIFMISSSAILESGLPVKLPPADSGVMTSSKQPVLITITRDGAMAVNDRQTTEDALRDAIEQALAETSDKTVIIRGDESIPLGLAVKTLDAARSAGAETISIATRPPG